MENKKAFCNKWGVRCELHSSVTGDGARPHGVPWDTFHSRGMAQKKRKKKESKNLRYEKLYRLLEVMEEAEEPEPGAKVGWVMMMDCDAVFTDFNIDWREQWRGIHSTNTVMVGGLDKNGFNAGVYIIPQTKVALWFVQQVEAAIPQAVRSGLKWRDQRAMLIALEENPGCRAMVRSVPRRRVNAYFPEEWTKQDWIAHQVGCHHETCNPPFLQLIQSVKERN